MDPAATPLRRTPILDELLERLRRRWERSTGPLLDLLGWLQPNHLTWASLVAALAAAWVGLGAGREAVGPWLLVAGLMGIAFLFDALDGQLARRRSLDGPTGDLLDHTLDRVVDAALLVALVLSCRSISRTTEALP